MRRVTLMVVLLFGAILFLAAAGCSRQHKLPTSPGGVTVGGQRTAIPTPDQIPEEDPPGGGGGPPVLNEDFTGHQLFTSGNPYTVNVSNASVDTASDTIIAWIRANGGEHFGAYFGDNSGIPYIGVSGTQTRVPVWFDTYHFGNSDVGDPGYPIPEEAKTTAGWIEGGVAGGDSTTDSHMIIVDRDNWKVYETWATQWVPTSPSRWRAGYGAVWNVASTYAPRPANSASASGLPLFPGLVRYDEVSAAGAIPHGFAAGVRWSNGYVSPATAETGNHIGPCKLGMRLRLKASFDIEHFPPAIYGHLHYPAPMQKILQAMKTYGLIIIDDTGGGFSTGGTRDANWPTLVAGWTYWINNCHYSLSADDFEVVQP